jgi:hypothetical protein
MIQCDAASPLKSARSPSSTRIGGTAVASGAAGATTDADGLASSCWSGFGSESGSGDGDAQETNIAITTEETTPRNLMAGVLYRQGRALSTNALRSPFAPRPRHGLRLHGFTFSLSHARLAPKQMALSRAISCTTICIRLRTINMDILLTGSVAYDYLMTFPGRFRDHLLPEQLEKVSLSFLVDSMSKQRGGIAPNIAFTLALLGQRPRVMATVGEDFTEYRAWMESQEIDTNLMKVIAGEFTASFFATTDQSSAQIASFYPGAMARSSVQSVSEVEPRPDLVVVSPSAPDAMTKFCAECRSLGIRYLYDPSQQVLRLSGEERGTWREPSSVLQ